MAHCVAFNRRKSLGLVKKKVLEKIYAIIIYGINYTCASLALMTSWMFLELQISLDLNDFCGLQYICK